MKDQLISVVLEQIEQDIAEGQTDAIFSLLCNVKVNDLLSFLPKDTQNYVLSDKFWLDNKSARV